MDATTRSREGRARSARAAPLSPPERRAAIVAAAVPLLRRHGLAVTTRQIAEAACVAEGTIFSVFGDKESLIEASVEAALDPGPVVERLEAIDGDASFEARLIEAVRILQEHVVEVWQLLAAVGPDGQPRRSIDARNEAAARHVAALEPIFASRCDLLRHPPVAAARALLAVSVGCSHPGLLDRPMTPEEVVDLVLEGVVTG